jgi:phosphoesterase RecJ-like protein
MSAVDWPAFAELVNGHESFLLTSHIRPDCDALGSELGMAAVLEGLGKKVRIVNGHPTPPNLAFIDPDKKIESLSETLTPAEVLQGDFEVMMILDTSAWAQLGDMGDVVRGTQAQVAIVDHHVAEDDLNARLFKNTSAEATGRLVCEAAEHLNVTLDAKASMAVYAAIATDTGWFRFGSTSATTYQWAAYLVEHGAVPASIYGALYEQETLGRMRLRGRVLARIETERDGRLAHTFISKDDFETTGAVPSDTEDLVNHLLAIQGTKVAVIFVEQEGGGFKLSFRSRCGVNCSEVASHFNGGGHKAAAGAFVAGELENVVKPVLDAVRSAMEACGE